MLTNASFVTWANEHLVVIIPHNELGHDPIEAKDYDGKAVRRCPLYPGIACRDHVDAAVDIDGARGDGLVKVPFLELCPNSWLVPPAGDPVQIPEADQFVAGKVRKHAEAMQKSHGAALSAAACGQIRNALAAAEAAVDADRFHAALEALKGIEKHVAQPHQALRALIRTQLEAVAEPVGWAFEDLVEGKEPLAERRAAVEALAKAVGVEVYGVPLPILATMTTWLKEHGGVR